MAKKKRTREPARPLTKTELAEVLNVISEETDRGCVLAVESLINDALEITLRELFARRAIIKKGETWKKEAIAYAGMLDQLFFATPNPPIGTFSVRIDLCWALGLINQQWRDALHEFRDMRNDAAHGRMAFRLDNYPLEKMRNLLSPSENRILRAIETDAAEKRLGYSKARLGFQFIGLPVYVRLMMVASDLENVSTILKADTVNSLGDSLLTKWQSEHTQ